METTMRFFAAVLLTATISSINYEVAKARQDMIPIEIRVLCQGVNFETSTQQDMAAASKALEGSFNRVFLKEYGDYLSYVDWNGPTKSMDGSSTVFRATMARGLKHPPSNTMEAELHGDWENYFTMMMTQSHSYPSFRNTGTCNIYTMMRADSRALRSLPPSLSATSIKDLLQEVNINVKCLDVDFSALIPGDLSFSAKALESTYNLVHTEIDGDFLQDAIPVGEDANERDGYTFQANWFSTCALGGERIRREEAVTYKVPELHYAWEAMFLSRLVTHHGSDDSELNKAGHCSILIYLKDSSRDKKDP